VKWRHCSHREHRVADWQEREQRRKRNARRRLVQSAEQRLLNGVGQRHFQVRLDQCAQSFRLEARALDVRGELGETREAVLAGDHRLRVVELEIEGGNALEIEAAGCGQLGLKALERRLLLAAESSQ